MKYAQNLKISMPRRAGSIINNNGHISRRTFMASPPHPDKVLRQFNSPTFVSLKFSILTQSQCECQQMSQADGRKEKETDEQKERQADRQADRERET